MNDQPSLRLQVATSYFAIGGMAITGASIYQLLRLATGSLAPVIGTARPLWGLMSALVTGTSWLVTSWVLHRRKRRGIGFALVGLLATLGSGLSLHDLRALSYPFLIGAVALFVSVWRELE